MESGRCKTFGLRCIQDKVDLRWVGRSEGRNQSTVCLSSNQLTDPTIGDAPLDDTSPTLHIVLRKHHSTLNSTAYRLQLKHYTTLCIRHFCAIHTTPQCDSSHTAAIHFESGCLRVWTMMLILVLTDRHQVLIHHR